MKICTSHSKGAEVKAKPGTPSSGLIPVPGVLIPYPRSGLGQTPSLSLHGFILLLMQGKAQFMIPGFASASSPSLFDGSPKMACLNFGHLSWPGRLSQIFLFSRGKQLGWFSLPGAPLPYFYCELIHIFISHSLFLGWIEEPLSRQCSFPKAPFTSSLEKSTSASPRMVVGGSEAEKGGREEVV